MTIDELIARLEAATGPSRELDREIADVFGLGPDESWERPMHQPGIHNMDVGAWIKGSRLRESPRYSSSIDAAVELAERLLPGRDISWSNFSRARGYSDGCTAIIGDTTWGSDPEAMATHKLPALALVIATLRAKAQEDNT